MAASVQFTQEAHGFGVTSPGAAEITCLSRSSAPPPAPGTLSQAEEGSGSGSATPTANNEGEEERRKAEAKERAEAGGVVAVLGFSTLLGCLWLPNEARHANNVPFATSLFLAFATSISGIALMLLGIIMLGLRADLVSASQYVAAKCLVVSCAAFSVLTLVSLVALLGRRLYQYICIAAVTVFLLPAGCVHCYLRRRTGGGAPYDDEHMEELEAASKVTSCITNSAFGGLVGVLFSASKVSGDAVHEAAYVATFFMFTTAILGVFVMTVSKKVPGITKQRFRRFLITVIRMANGLLLCSLACAAFAAAFVVLRYRVFAAFTPLVISGIICFLLQHSVVRRGRAGEADNDRERQEQLKAMEDLASKVTTATFGGIMSVLGASIGEKHNSKLAVATDMCMVVLTSAFVSGFGFMLLAAVPGSARARLAPAAKVLVWSSVVLFAATAVAVYSVGVWTM